MEKLPPIIVTLQVCGRCHSVVLPQETDPLDIPCPTCLEPYTLVKTTVDALIASIQLVEGMLHRATPVRFHTPAPEDDVQGWSLTLAGRRWPKRPIDR